MLAIMVGVVVGPDLAVHGRLDTEAAGEACADEAVELDSRAGGLSVCIGTGEASNEYTAAQHVSAWILRMAAGVGIA